MTNERTRKEYKSPRRKLIKFFEKSRDQWKTKSIESKKKVKRLQNRIRYLEMSKGSLKNQIKVLKKEVAVLKAQEQERIEETKKR